MGNLKNFVNFIESVENGEDYYYEETWIVELTKNIPNWREIVKNKDNWSVIDKIRTKKNYDNLFKIFVKEVGLELAKRWLFSDNSDQRYAAKDWFENNLKLFCDLEEDVLDEVKAIFRMYKDDLEESFSLQSNSFINTIRSLSAEGLSEVMEMLLRSEAFKRRYTLQEESVGGNIHVATITKRDGFVWQKK